MTGSRVPARTWALLPLAVLLAVGLSLVGAWQWRVAMHRGTAELSTTAPAPVTDVVPTRRALERPALGRVVTAEGRYDAAGTLLVTGHRLDGRGGSWVLVPLRTSEGTVLPVVRGFLPTGQTVPDPPRGTVRLTGRVQAPSGGGAVGPAAPTGAGTVSAIDTAELVNRWGGPIHPAYVVVQRETPAAASLARVPAQPFGSTTSLQLRNLAYALQWFAFAAFVLLFWGRLVRDDVRSGRPERGPAPGSRPWSVAE